ncbi:dephospho-CoA kinase [Cohaesibacter celericrescens]|jgi:dephospho-CoA kinase|uniref:Dephospho-CoA kinase n=1 Tax=Cohaesibacter celericrescens TaxID=2067669 RepID=A0A2N5XNY3_9HYPH|nr:dephospho-CoA kinase [Cohaesibacter celericrescens]PLW76251.1 dephospho-CoA kinase [Cohaesibacter celericrescens]
MIKIGLTGSIGMGKTTTGQMFVARGCPLHDADATVHRLYSERAAPLIEEAFPGTTSPQGVDRAALSKHVIGKPEAMKRLEAIIHPLVREEEKEFFEMAKLDGSQIVVLDIPLLFETGAEDRVDVIVVVSAPEDIQRQRVLARDGMTEDKFAAIKARQMPDAEKRHRADFIVDTGQGLEAAQAQVDSILATIKSRLAADA